MDNNIAKKARSVFASNLERYLKSTGKAQADLVDYLGVTSSTVSDWVNGRKYPRVDKMQRMAEYFGILISDLTEERPANYAPPEDNQAALETYNLLKEAGIIRADGTVDRERYDWFIRVSRASLNLPDKGSE